MATTQDPSKNSQVIDQDPAATDQDSGMMTEADEKAASSASEESEKEEPLDMSLDARMARAKFDLQQAIKAQAEINRVVRERTDALDELIIEQNNSKSSNPMTEIRFYLERQQRKRQENAEKQQKMRESGFDPVELIKQLDNRAPIDQRPAVRKADPRSVKKPAVPAAK